MGEIDLKIGSMKESEQNYIKAARFYREMKNESYEISSLRGALNARDIEGQYVTADAMWKILEPQAVGKSLSDGNVSTPTITGEMAATKIAFNTESIKRTLSFIRSACTVYYADHEGQYPVSLIELTKNGKYLKHIPDLSLPDHPQNRNITDYPGYSGKENDLKNLKDSGTWGYVPRNGIVFVDCIHKSGNGKNFAQW